MKKLLLLINMLLVGLVGNAQVLFSDNFDSYTVGNLGTDLSGVVPGQGGWFTKKASVNSRETLNSISVVSEIGRGKVLQLTNGNLSLSANNLDVYQSNIDQLINVRTVGNNVIVLQFDLFTGPQKIDIVAPHHDFHEFFLHTKEDSLNSRSGLFKFRYFYHSGKITLNCKDMSSTDGVFWHLSSAPTIPFNMWVTFKIYLDYNNRKIYVEIPYNNKVYISDFLIYETATNLLEKYKPKFFGSKFQIDFDYIATKPYESVYSKIDNISLTALYSVPPHVLSAATFLNDKFNIYPNPASNLVTITSAENLPVQQITVYDMAGKQLSTQTFNNQTEIQLNVAQFANGTYMLNIQTTKGTAVKQLVKK